MTKKKTKKATKKEIKLPIKWHVPENMISRYATNMTVQLLENEFKLAFFELSPNIRTDPSVPPQKEVQANCVGSIIVNINTVPKIIDVLKRQLDLFIAKNSPKKK